MIFQLLKGFLGCVGAVLPLANVEAGLTIPTRAQHGHTYSDIDKWWDSSDATEEAFQYGFGIGTATELNQQ
uniref:Uncharacterized protein n=1 Tax=Romanomermis culicivorax TaxID=13658 RepID=A0A915L1N4_ROMCU